MKQGEIFGLLGPNGAGKSTLIRMMTTLMPITSGRALINGFDVAKDPDDARNCMGVIPQALTSDIDLTVEENLSIYAKLYDVPRARAQAQHRRAARDRRPHQVARRTGQDALRRHAPPRWRSRAAWCTIRGSSFLDEPTTGLDPVSRVAVWEMLNTLKSRRRLTILITTHYMDEADRLCDRIAIVDHGNLVALDSPGAEVQRARQERDRGAVRGSAPDW